MKKQKEFEEKMDSLPFDPSRVSGARVKNIIDDEVISSDKLSGYKDDAGKQESLIPVAFYHYVMQGRFYNELEIINRLYSRHNGAFGTLVFHEALFSAISEVLHYGVSKYGKKDSWQLVENGEQRYFDAFLRHAQAMEEIDEESGIAHWKHAACNLMFVWWFNAQKE